MNSVRKHLVFHINLGERIGRILDIKTTRDVNDKVILDGVVDSDNNNYEIEVTDEYITVEKEELEHKLSCSIEINNQISFSSNPLQ